MPSTQELVKSAQSGEVSAFAELVRCYERAAILTAHSLLGDFHLAQDAAQEAFVIAYQRLNQLRDADAFVPWLLQVVRRRALRCRHRRQAEPIEAQRIDDGSDCFAAPNAPDWLEPYEDVVRQMVRLPEHERIVTVMRYIDGRSVQEISDATGRPVGTITKQLSRAIERLRKWFFVSSR
jgi:RNA polymerase sigma-70 factor, ECF subfamily